MALIKKPVTGMKDILPREMRIRDYLIALIKETYSSFGFTPIETPAVENIANLSSKQGGENEKLIFKILKRGDKLDIAAAAESGDANELVDGGLRYDLTVPLVRFYSNNQANLPVPFKALQIGSVWRADRPQKGRFRQFYQCDIDILGEPGNIAEIELILATTTTLSKIGFKDFKIHINERRMLKAMAAYSGFAEEDYDNVFIILDKMDKIGIDGVKSELAEAGYATDVIDKYTDLLTNISGKASLEAIEYLGNTLGSFLEEGTADSLREIIETVDEVKTGTFEMLFDPTLVRGMSYYTGTIFEIEVPEFGSSVGGGGRYDKMVGRFTGQDTPACGFSIGFERIVTILLDNDYVIPDESEKIAFLVEKGITGRKLSDIISKATMLRSEGKQILMVRMNKNKKFQKEQLASQGYDNFEEFYLEELKK